MFDAIADNYDFLNHLLSAGIDRRWRRRAIRSLALTGSERVLDLCTGTGDLAIAAVDARPGAARVIGVDFAAAMLRVGAEKLRQRQLDRSVTLVRGDATRIPLATGSVNGITVAFGIRNVENIELEPWLAIANSFGGSTDKDKAAGATDVGFAGLTASATELLLEGMRRLDEETRKPE